MKRSFLFSFCISTLFIAACSSGGDKINVQAPVAEVKSLPDSAIAGTETSWLINDLKNAGDYVNSREFPSLIKASVVNESLGSNIHIIDIRESSKFSKGHIPGSVNKKFEQLPAWFEKGIKPFEFDKIILVCDDGQVSSYATSLLRIMGYGNVYAMRWGMSAWNDQFASENWKAGLSGKFESQLEKKENPRPAGQKMPELKTGLSSGSEIAQTRFKEVFQQGTSNVLISADEVFSDPSKYFVINYERKDKYDDAHVPGAVRYKPNATLGFIQEMGSIPVDKTVVVYCGTGHNSAFATAYLRLMGYDARTLKYGNNSFMYEWMKKDAAGLSWLPFTDAEVNNYNLEK